MYDKLSKEVKEIYKETLTNISQDNYDRLKYCPPEHKIISLISEYEATKTALASQIHKEQLLQYKIDNQIHKLKKEFMAEGMKSTEAKEKAKDTLNNEYTQLFQIQEDITLLKAIIQSIEYKLRLSYTQLEQMENSEWNTDSQMKK